MSVVVRALAKEDPVGVNKRPASELLRGYTGIENLAGAVELVRLVRVYSCTR